MAGPTTERKGDQMTARVLLAAALLAFAVIIYLRWVPSYYGLVDEQGYLTTAKQLATHGTFMRRQTDPYAFVGETMMQSPHDPTAYYLRQPIGYPVLCAAAYYLGGQDAPFAVNPLMGLALIVGIYVVGAELGSALMGAVAGLVIALHPLVWYYTVMALSHLPDMATATWAVAFALMWRREGRLWQAVAAAIVLGLAVWIRYTNVLMVLPLGVVVFARWRTERRKAAVATAISAAVLGMMLVPLALYQAVAFGSVLKTGYSAGGNATSFSWGWFVQHAPAMGAILLRPGVGLSAIVVGIVAGAIILARRDRSTLALLLLWALPPLLLYTAYYGMPARNTVLYARFALGSFVPLLLLGLIWSQHLRTPRWTYAAIALALVTIGLNLFNPSMARQATDLENQMLFALATAREVNHDVPTGSVVLTTDVLHYFLDYAGDFIVYEPGLFEVPRIAKRVADLTSTPREFDPARTEQIARLLGGKTEAELQAVLQAQLKAYADAGKGIYAVASAADAALLAEGLHVRMTPVGDSGLGPTVYRVEFAR